MATLACGCDATISATIAIASATTIVTSIATNTPCRTVIPGPTTTTTPTRMWLRDITVIMTTTMTTIIPADDGGIVSSTGPRNPRPFFASATHPQLTLPR